MPTQRQITVRRAPKYVPFLVAGGLLGVIIAAATSFSVPAPKDYTQGSVFGYFLVLFAAGGVLVGAVVALILDRVSLRRAERATVEEVEEPASAAPGAPAQGEETHDAGPAPSSADPTDASADHRTEGGASA
ncbi:hypothetical protein GCM10027449_17810 [Sinomonas notoginsengisoli]|uniref:hypothetical protein n=1 Tax=Sinomonas notoginsengisoli TaxID=1457311 RepID=UPI001F256845|nr:hypothetical protein [Sinomonas notoginsengisoli]